MGPQTGLPWTILLLFFLHLLLAGGLAHPLVGLDQDQASDQLGTQELLHHPGDGVWETQTEQMIPGPLLPDREPAECCQGKAAPKSSLQGFRGLQTPKVMQGSSCFGRRIDRIGSVSGLGCKVQRRP
ncbi:natriuretic peptides B [Heterocephalus glaber]|uniref:Natriuretic peptides B n=1 Tax=Heterocephalus glaber TaxID=10181 RepID=A0AAX6PYV7_HETGA|nr:natriuretic peptides B [Heterocephalus glaber]